MRLRPIAAARQRLARLWQDEDGAGTVLALSLLLICLMLSGLAIDTSNAWRHREILQLTADTAAHAGLAELARGAPADVAEDRARDTIALNAPENYGQIVDNPLTDITALHYDAETQSLTPDGPVNAIRVRVQRSATVENRVPTLLLKMVGLEGWDIGATSIAVLAPTRRCSNAEGLFSHATLTVTAQVEFGEATCLHSQTSVALDQRVKFDAGAGLSMPDLRDCDGKCDDIYNPGIEAAATEVNLLMPRTADHIAGLQAGFIATGTTLPEKDAFFATRPLAANLSALQEMGVDTERLRAGSVVELSPLEFIKMREFPEGLVYSVTCAADDSFEDAQGWSDLTIWKSENPILKDLALVTNCKLRFEAGSSVQGVFILTTYSGKHPALVVEAGARAGDPTLTCDPARQSIVMVMGSAQIPAAFATSNLALVTGGDLVLQADENPTQVAHHGTALHAGGSLRIEGANTFTSCNQAMNPLLPGLQVMAYVAPKSRTTLPAKPMLPKVEPEMPGEAPKPLERAPNLIGREPAADQPVRLSGL